MGGPLRLQKESPAATANAAPARAPLHPGDTFRPDRWSIDWDAAASSGWVRVVAVYCRHCRLLVTPCFPYTVTGLSAFTSETTSSPASA